MKIVLAIVIGSLVIGGALWIGSDNFYRVTYDQPKEEVNVDHNTIPRELPIPEPIVNEPVINYQYRECITLGAILYLQGSEMWTTEHTEEVCSVYLN